MIHQPLGGFQGQAADMEIHAKEMLETRDRLNKILAKHTGQSVEQIKHDTDRDHFMDWNEAVALRADRPRAREARRAAGRRHSQPALAKLAERKRRAHARGATTVKVVNRSYNSRAHKDLAVRRALRQCPAPCYKKLRPARLVRQRGA